MAGIGGDRAQLRRRIERARIGRGKRAGKAVKSAGKAAADAVKRRLTEEIDAIKKAAKDAKATKA